jgi:hypothetical protein
MHGVPAGQAVPQAPQLAWLVKRSVHTPLHAVCPVGHASVHLPCTQDCPAVHAAPHALQWLGFVATSAHSTPFAPAQGWSGHAAAQAPLTQNWPTAHAVPQAPQFVGSLTMVLQTPPHSA